MTVRKKTDIEIGKRFVSQLYRIFPGASNRKIARILRCSQTNIQTWNEGKTPGAIFLARSIEHGCDIHYVLTDRRQFPVIEPDFLAEYEEEYN